MKRRVGPFLNDRTHAALIGVDEAGRGSWCAGVVAAAVWFDPGRCSLELLGALDDSKALTARQRATALSLIEAECVIGIGARSARAIDRSGIVRATMEAMADAVMRCRRKGGAGLCVVDGLNIPPGIEGPVESLVGSEKLRPQCAAAGIVAKEFRSRMLKKIARGAASVYGWERNDGYGTREHAEALKRYGPSHHHRISYGPISQPVLGL